MLGDVFHVFNNADHIIFGIPERETREVNPSDGISLGGIRHDRTMGLTALNSFQTGAVEARDVSILVNIKFSLLSTIRLRFKLVRGIT